MRIRRIPFGPVALLVGLALGGCKPSQPTIADPAPASPAAMRTFDVRGTIISLKPERSAVVIEHEEIPGYMNAMTMPFSVRDTNELAGLIPGEEVRFKMIVTEDDAWIEDIETLGERLDEYINAQKTATGFDLRYTGTMKPPEKDWREFTEVLSRRDLATLMSVAWT